MEQQTSSKLGKEYIKAVYYHPVYLTYMYPIYLTYMQSFMWNTGLDDSEVGIKIARRNINNLRYADDATLMAEEELESLLMRVKKESKNVGLKLNIQKTKIMTFSPITSWQIDGEKVETVTDFIFLGSKITADSWLRPQKMLVPWKKIYDQPRQHIKKQRHHFAKKGMYIQSYGFSSSHLWIWELMLSNCGVGEGSWESLAQQGDQISQS